MPLLKLVVILEEGGQPVQGFPLHKTISLDEVQRFFYEQVGQGDATTFLAVPADKVDNVQAFLLRVDKAVTLRIDNQTDRGVRLNAGGLILVLDATVDQGAGANNLKLNNPAAAGVVALVQGFAGGT